MRLLDRGGVAELSWDLVGDHLASDGVVMIRCGGLGEVMALLAEWTEPVAHPHDVELGVTVVAPRRSHGGAAGRAGFTRAALAPHTDRSLQPAPPSVLSAVLTLPAKSDGHALLADGARVLAALRRVFSPAEIAGLRLRTAAGSAMPIVTTRDDLVSIRFRDDLVARPCSSTGDQHIVAALRTAIAAETRTIPLLSGDGYILHNHRYLHGRSSFTGDRRLVRTLARATSGPLAWLNQGFHVAAA